MVVQEKVIYDSNFYTNNAKNNLISAQLIVPYVIDLFQPKSLVDLGCGSQIWIKTYYDHGIKDILGVDGDWIKEESMQLGVQNFKRHNLSQPFAIDRKFDFAMSLEVAEHLPESSAEGFVDSLTKLADVIMFSAAIPHQGGVEHINEQWPDYWQKFFEARGYKQYDVLRPMLWEKEGVSVSYKQNMFFYVHPRAQAAQAKLEEIAAKTPRYPTRLVHPELFSFVATNLDDSQKRWLESREAQMEKERKEYQQTINRLRNLEDIPVSVILRRLPELLLSRGRKRFDASP